MINLIQLKCIVGELDDTKFIKFDELDDKKYSWAKVLNKLSCQ